MTIEISEDELALRTLVDFGDHPSGFLALNEGTERFTAAGLRGFIAYRRSGRYLIQFGGPFAPAEDRMPLLARFIDLAATERRKVVAIQLQRADAERYAEVGFTVNQVGATYALDLDGFTLRGTRFMRLRNKMSRARRSGLRVIETTTEECTALTSIDKRWLRSKGRHVKEIEFLVGQVGGPMQAHRRLFVGLLEGEPVAYISYSPVYGERPGWLHDLSRRLPDVAPGTMETINAAAIEAFRAAGTRWLHFGFTPFTGLDPALEVSGASPMVGRFIRLLAAHGAAVYPAKSQVSYKEKWGDLLVLPEYLAFYGRPRIGGIWQILRTSKSL
ncbi:MAG TPA: DUF2156 domain-containing protein [Streptosporangiaceae bacterium]